jgi:hypothetical protein
MEGEREEAKPPIRTIAPMESRIKPAMEATMTNATIIFAP